MIDLYFAPTPNGQKVSIMLEEVELPYNMIRIDFSKEDQFKPEFLKISPNNKIPAIIDHDGLEGKPYSMFESGAILYYLAEKTGKLLPKHPQKKYDVMQWLMFQMGGLGPMLGQVHHFLRFAPENIEYGINRYTKEMHRLYHVLNTQLEKNEFIAGNEYSIADIAVWPWVARHEWQKKDLNEVASVKRWYEQLQKREALQRGHQLGQEETLLTASKN